MINPKRTITRKLGPIVKMIGFMVIAMALLFTLSQQSPVSAASSTISSPVMARQPLMAMLMPVSGLRLILILKLWMAQPRA